MTQSSENFNERNDSDRPVDNNCPECGAIASIIREDGYSFCKDCFAVWAEAGQNVPSLEYLISEFCVADDNTEPDSIPPF